MRPINHLVLAGHDLKALRALYADLGFPLTPRSQHPFGTGNTVIQLRGAYLELLAVTAPSDVVEHTAATFSFSAFNRDYLARHEGFSMLVMDGRDAAADIAAWRVAGLKTYAPFDFSRTARLPSGEDVTVGFSLAFTSTPEAPWLGHFACQHLRRDYFEQPQYLRHANTAWGVDEVWIVSEPADVLEKHLATFLDGHAERDGRRLVFATHSGRIVLSDARDFTEVFGEPPPHPQDGPHLAAVTIGCRTLDVLETAGLSRVGERLVLPSARAFGTVLAFRTVA
ncbi:MAG: VOC family protein [Rhizobiaceae bacterium]